MTLVKNRKIRRLWCLIVGHDLHYSYGLGWGEDYCKRCWYGEREINLDESTLPVYFNRIYCWLIGRSAAFRAVDSLLIKYSPWLPNWWEY